MENARKSNIEIAMAIGVVEETVRRRRAGLQRDGVYEVVAIASWAMELSFSSELRQLHPK